MSTHPTPDAAELRTERRNTVRLEALSDGVIAIAITLLILEIRVPEVEAAAGAEGLVQALGQLWPSLIAFALSFIVIGIIWIWHHTLFRFIERADQALMVANVVLLMTISFIPFPTALLGAYIESESQRSVAVAVYGIAGLAMALGFNLVWRYARWRGLLVPGANPASVAAIDRAFTITPIVYAVTIVLAFILPLLTLAIHLAIPLYYALARPSPRVEASAEAS